MKRINIGVIIYTKIGTKTSILLGEFEFWNDFQRMNPDCDFYFISISKNTTKSIIDHQHLLNFPVRMIPVYDAKDLPKLNSLSGVFSYMTRNTFFGGQMNPSCVHNYVISAYCSNTINIPLFIRTPDSEYPYLDYKKMADVRIEKATPSTPKFIRENKRFLDVMTVDIKYENVYFVANGSRHMCDWVQDIVYHDIPEVMRIMEPEEISRRTLYVSDDVLFNLHINEERYSNLNVEVKNDKLLFIGFLSGSVAKNRLVALTKMLKAKTEEIPMDIIGPGADLLMEDIIREDVTLEDRSIFGDEFFKLLNKYLAYVFIGKGNAINKYVNKTIYDCISAKCPIVVYSACDTNQAIFKSDEYYFSNESELKSIIGKLRDPAIRNRWIVEQKADIEEKLTHNEEIFKFSQFCKPKEKVVNNIRTEPLF